VGTRLLVGTDSLGDRGCEIGGAVNSVEPFFRLDVGWGLLRT